MSRICVKNIPKYVDEDRLRDFFSQKGEITDAKIMRTRDRKSRQFAFIGFRTEEEAKDAMRFFNNSYLDTCRITCEVARKVGDPDIPRPWSKHSTNKDNVVNTNKKVKEDVSSGSGFLNKQRSSKEAEKMRDESLNVDPRLQEFLQVMQPRLNSKLWANDTTGTSLEVVQNKKSIVNRKKKSDKIEAGSEKDSDEDEIFDTGDNGTIEGSTDKLPEMAGHDNVSDLDYFKSRVKKNWSDTESDDENFDGEQRSDIDSKNDHVTQVKEVYTQGDPLSEHKDKHLNISEELKTKNEDTSSAPGDDDNEHTLETSRLFVRNLPYTTNEDELTELFSKYGDVSNVHLVLDKDTRISKGICYVLYTLPESAVRALEELDNTIFQGRLLHVLPAKPQILPTNKPQPDIADGKGAKTFKQKREHQKKASEASGDTKSWNALFIRPDTVVENIARKYGVSKSDLLDRDADDIAVRIALGEAHVIAETKASLSRSGVNVTSLEDLTSKNQNSKRSNHVILVKNLPYGSCEGDLEKMFGHFGSLDKIILPPTKALALVVFLEPSEARAAFKGLAYKRYKDAPLYLEWAPSCILSPKSVLEANEEDNVVGAKRALLEQTVEGISEVDLDLDRVESRSLFVKNLNFKTSDESLKKHFSDKIKKGQILSAKIKKHLKNGKNLSTGYGFMEFCSVETATEVCRDLQGTVLDGHALILQFCHSKKEDRTTKNVNKDDSSTKLIVRNVAFEATEKDLKQLFGQFGQIKSIRLPQKFDSHRGFAFVEYITTQEAKKAMQALANTHLYGRHLVLEKAKGAETLEELRARTAAKFSDDHNIVEKLSKKRKHMSLMDDGNTEFEKIMG